LISSEISSRVCRSSWSVVFNSTVAAESDGDWVIVAPEGCWLVWPPREWWYVVVCVILVSNVKLVLTAIRFVFQIFIVSSIRFARF
jgi:hypothetical protein